MEFKPQEYYRWEAELQNGEVIEKGGDLTNAVRISLIPNKAGLPQHDFVGVEFVRRFGRGFVNVMSGSMKDYAHCICLKDSRAYVRCSDGAVLITPKDYELYL